MSYEESLENMLTDNEAKRISGQSKRGVKTDRSWLKEMDDINGRADIEAKKKKRKDDQKKKKDKKDKKDK